MTISSRTPEGEANRCSICGARIIEPSRDSDDAPCPRCGHLLWWFQEKLSKDSSVGRLSIDTPLADAMAGLGTDSLDTAELVMELEEEFDVTISDEDAEKIATLGDAIRYIESRRGPPPRED